jgi:2-polyprenyl-3-methyl-5-hydroxy-6-metoxy-1,4-benzoquinol methylase
MAIKTATKTANQALFGDMPSHTVKLVDRIIQWWRISKVRPYIPQGARVLDIGCADGSLFRQLGQQIGSGIGVDPELARSVANARFQLIAGSIPSDLAGSQFDAATMLAVAEHLPDDTITAMRDQCVRLLKPGGVLLITVPSTKVDAILNVLIWLRLAGNMSFDQHHGFDTRTVPARFGGTGLELVKHTNFQFGLNNLYVFRRTAPSSAHAS